MIVIDIIYYILVLWTGLIVALNTNRKESNNSFLSKFIAALLIMCSLKNLILLFLAD